MASTQQDLIGYDLIINDGENKFVQIDPPPIQVPEYFSSISTGDIIFDENYNITLPENINIDDNKTSEFTESSTDFHKNEFNCRNNTARGLFNIEKLNDNTAKITFFDGSSRIINDISKLTIVEPIENNYTCLPINNINVNKSISNNDYKVEKIVDKNKKAIKVSINSKDQENISLDEYSETSGEEYIQYTYTTYCDNIKPIKLNLKLTPSTINSTNFNNYTRMLNYDFEMNKDLVYNKKNSLFLLNHDKYSNYYVNYINNQIIVQNNYTKTIFSKDKITFLFLYGCILKVEYNIDIFKKDDNQKIIIDESTKNMILKDKYIFIIFNNHIFLFKINSTLSSVDLVFAKYFMNYKIFNITENIIKNKKDNDILFQTINNNINYDNNIDITNILFNLIKFHIKKNVSDTSYIILYNIRNIGHKKILVDDEFQILFYDLNDYSVFIKFESNDKRIQVGTFDYMNHRHMMNYYDKTLTDDKHRIKTNYLQIDVNNDNDNFLQNNKIYDINLSTSYIDYYYTNITDESGNVFSFNKILDNYGFYEYYCQFFNDRENDKIYGFYISKNNIKYLKYNLNEINHYNLLINGNISQSNCSNIINLNYDSKNTDLPYQIHCYSPLGLTNDIIIKSLKYSTEGDEIAKGDFILKFNNFIDIYFKNNKPKYIVKGNNNFYILNNVICYNINNKLTDSNTPDLKLKTKITFDNYDNYLILDYINNLIVDKYGNIYHYDTNNSSLLSCDGDEILADISNNSQNDLLYDFSKSLLSNDFLVNIPSTAQANDPVNIVAFKGTSISVSFLMDYELNKKMMISYVKKHKKFKCYNSTDENKNIIYILDLENIVITDIVNNIQYCGDLTNFNINLNYCNNDMLIKVKENILVNNILYIVNNVNNNNNHILSTNNKKNILDLNCKYELLQINGIIYIKKSKNSNLHYIGSKVNGNIITSSLFFNQINYKIHPIFGYVNIGSITYYLTTLNNIIQTDKLAFYTDIYDYENFYDNFNNNNKTWHYYYLNISGSSVSDYKIINGIEKIKYDNKEYDINYDNVNNNYYFEVNSEKKTINKILKDITITDLNKKFVYNSNYVTIETDYIVNDDIINYDNIDYKIIRTLNNNPTIKGLNKKFTYNTDITGEETISVDSTNYIITNNEVQILSSTYTIKRSSDDIMLSLNTAYTYKEDTNKTIIISDSTYNLINNSITYNDKEYELINITDFPFKFFYYDVENNSILTINVYSITQKTISIKQNSDNEISTKYDTITIDQIDYIIEKNNDDDNIIIKKYDSNEKSLTIVSKPENVNIQIVENEIVFEIKYTIINNRICYNNTYYLIPLLKLKTEFLYDIYTSGTNIIEKITLDTNYNISSNQITYNNNNCTLNLKEYTTIEIYKNLSFKLDKCYFKNSDNIVVELPIIDNITESCKLGAGSYEVINKLYKFYTDYQSEIKKVYKILVEYPNSSTFSINNKNFIYDKEYNIIKKTETISGQQYTYNYKLLNDVEITLGNTKYEYNPFDNTLTDDKNIYNIIITDAIFEKIDEINYESVKQYEIDLENSKISYITTDTSKKENYNIIDYDNLNPNKKQDLIQKYENGLNNNSLIFIENDITYKLLYNPLDNTTTCYKKNSDEDDVKLFEILANNDILQITSEDNKDLNIKKETFVYNFNNSTLYLEYNNEIEIFKINKTIEKDSEGKLIEKPNYLNFKNYKINGENTTKNYDLLLYQSSNFSSEPFINYTELYHNGDIKIINSTKDLSNETTFDSTTQQTIITKTELDCVENIYRKSCEETEILQKKLLDYISDITITENKTPQNTITYSISTKDYVTETSSYIFFNIENYYIIYIKDITNACETNILLNTNLSLNNIEIKYLNSESSFNCKETEFNYNNIKIKLNYDTDTSSKIESFVYNNQLFEISKSGTGADEVITGFESVIGNKIKSVYASYSNNYLKTLVFYDNNEKKEITFTNNFDEKTLSTDTIILSLSKYSNTYYFKNLANKDINKNNLNLFTNFYTDNLLYYYTDITKHLSYIFLDNSYDTNNYYKTIIPYYYKENSIFDINYKKLDNEFKYNILTDYDNKINTYDDLSIDYTNETIDLSIAKSKNSEGEKYKNLKQISYKLYKNNIITEYINPYPKSDSNNVATYIFNNHINNEINLSISGISNIIYNSDAQYDNNEDYILVYYNISNNCYTFIYNIDKICFNILTSETLSTPYYYDSNGNQTSNDNYVLSFQRNDTINFSTTLKSKSAINYIISPLSTINDETLKQTIGNNYTHQQTITFTFNDSNCTLTIYSYDTDKSVYNYYIKGLYGTDTITAIIDKLTFEDYSTNDSSCYNYENNYNFIIINISTNIYLKIYIEKITKNNKFDHFEIIGFKVFDCKSYIQYNADNNIIDTNELKITVNNQEIKIQNKDSTPTTLIKYDYDNNNILTDNLTISVSLYNNIFLNNCSTICTNYDFDNSLLEEFKDSGVFVPYYANNLYEDYYYDAKLPINNTFYKINFDKKNPEKEDLKENIGNIRCVYNTLNCYETTIKTDLEESTKQNIIDDIVITQDPQKINYNINIYKSCDDTNNVLITDNTINDYQIDNKTLDYNLFLCRNLVNFDNNIELPLTPINNKYFIHYITKKDNVKDNRISQHLVSLSDFDVTDNEYALQIEKMSSTKPNVIKLTYTNNKTKEIEVPQYFTNISPNIVKENEKDVTYNVNFNSTHLVKSSNLTGKEIKKKIYDNYKKYYNAEMPEKEKYGYELKYKDEEKYEVCYPDNNCCVSFKYPKKISDITPTSNGFIVSKESKNSKKYGKKKVFSFDNMFSSNIDF
jgi:hypothetical protein